MTTPSPEVIAATIQEAFEAAVAHYRSGQFEAAEELYRAILQLDPQHPNTNHNLGLLLAQGKRFAEALPLLHTALLAAPGEGRFWVSYLETLVSAGQYEAAQQTLALGRQHGLRPSEELIARIEAGPSPAPVVAPPPARQELPEAIRAQIRQAQQRKDWQTLEKLGEAAVATWPGAMHGWQALSLARYNTGRPEEALEPTRKLVELFPENAQMHANLGLMLMTLRRPREAEASLLHSIALDPNIADTHTNLGTVFRDLNRNGEAEICYRRAITLEPKHAVAHANLGTVLNERGDFREAEAHLRIALSLDPDNPSALGTLATALVKLGHLEEAETALRHAIKIKPDHLLAYDLLLFVLNYTHTDKSREARVLAARYGEQLTKKTAARYNSWLCDPAPQRLKVGVVSGDLRSHPIGYFIQALLHTSVAARMEFIAYSSMPPRKHDALTNQLRPMFSAWHSIHDISPEQAAARIHADGIHVLLDLSGHTSDNRLSVFAMKPAPVQASWLGYFATTGVAEMDGFIGDPWLCPPAEEVDFTEQIWRLPKTWLCFTPPVPDVAVAELPALKNGYVTFGCFNNLNKMNDAVVALWSEVLRRVPGSKLMLKAPQLADAEVRTLTLNRFAAQDIVADRLIFDGPDERADYLAAYGQVDFCLDPFPYPGGTTSVESLWMGVPVLTLRGNRFLSHLGESIAHNVGMPDWIATDKADYVAKAIAFAADIPALATLRAGMRERMCSSPLLDAPAFANDFADLLWQKWEHRPAPSAVPAPTKTTQSKPPPRSEIEQLQKLFQKQRYAELEKRGQEFVQRYPDAVAGWKALSLAQQHLGQPAAALTSTQRLLELLPNEAVSHARLGLILISLNRLSEAEAALRRAIELDPKETSPRINLGYIREQQGRIEEAEAGYRQAIEIDPKQATAHSNLGVLMLRSLKLREAEHSFRAALKLDPKDRNALTGLSSTLVRLGFLGEAESLARKAIKLHPEHAALYSTLLFALNYRNTDNRSGDALALAKQYGAMLSRVCKPRYTTWSCDPEANKLRLGLVSGDLYNHPVGYFLEGLLDHLDPARFEVYAYSNRAAKLDDETSQRLRARCTRWTTIDDLDDKAVAARIHADGIHILLDLAGHTGNSRLPVFAYKPAPIQAAWLGYFATTGVEQMDYLIADPNVCPPGEEDHFTETVWRLPETYLCFTPPKEDVPVDPLPMLSNGYVTFGCFNNIGKLTDSVVKLWTEILQQTPGARLLLKNRQLADAEIHRQTSERFAAHGIGPQQLMLEGPTPRKDYLAAYNRIDIALDPFPYPGGTTSVEAMWMGVPVLTMRGNRMLSHAGENIMTNVGLPEWIAADEADYLTKARAFAADSAALAALHAKLRERALSSPMFDAPRFARFFEEALWTMWERNEVI